LPDRLQQWRLWLFGNIAAASAAAGLEASMVLRLLLHRPAGCEGFELMLIAAECCTP
jgi:hypothetical protein